MERFVGAIVTGGIVFVGALWLLEFAARGSTVWVLGAGLALLGLGAVLAGIGSELETEALVGRE